MRYEYREICVKCKKGRDHLVWDDLTKYQKIAVEHIMTDQDEICQDCLDDEVKIQKELDDKCMKLRRYSYAISNLEKYRNTKDKKLKSYIEREVYMKRLAYKISQMTEESWK